MPRWVAVGFTAWVSVSVDYVRVCIVKSAQLARASQVIGIDPTLSRRQRALSFGATHVFTPEEALNAIRELTDGRGVDHLIEAAGVRNTL